MNDDLRVLVGQAQQADQQALTALIELYQTPARRVAQTILSNLPDAEDALQDAWLLALHKLHTLRQPEHFGAWFYRIVANVALRRRQQRAAQPGSLDMLETVLSVPDEPPAKHEALALLPLALASLSAKDKLVINLHYFSGVPLAQVALLLNLPQGTIKRRLHHARQVLRKELNLMSTQLASRPEHIPADFRQTIAGKKGKIEWQSIFNGDFNGWLVEEQPVPANTTPTHWQVIGKDGLAGELWQGGATLLYGDPQWHNVELSLLVTPLAGGNAQILFRAAEQGFYLCDLLMGWQAIAVSRVTLDGQGNGNLTKLSVVNYPLVHQHEYALTIAARDHSITTYVDGALVNQVTDNAWLHGRIGLNIWEAKTLFRDIRVRLLE
ncbi:MAG: sigma-70 family RNA polymerase sigma factor [Caldilineaceae bacterium]